MEMTFEKCEFPIIIIAAVLGLFVIISIVLMIRFRREAWSLCSCCLNLGRRGSYEAFDDQSYSLQNTCNRTECRSRFEQLKRETDDKNEALNRFERLKEFLKKETDEKNEAQNRLTRREKEIKDLGDELKNKEDTIRILEADLRKERDDKDDALKRLSAIMSSRLRDGNPNVVDLSDQNRPLKVGEQFSELYDNQWTDAFSVVKDSIRDNEQRVIGMLVEILEECFTICQTAAANQLDILKSNVATITNMITNKESKLPDDLMQRIKEERKMNAIQSVPEYHKVAQTIKEQLNRQAVEDLSFIDNPTVEAYIRECLKLCYLMVNQDPPMAIVSRPDQNAGENFKAYQHRGSRILFVVWPALYLQAGGPLVSKGVAEFGE